MQSTVRKSIEDDGAYDLPAQTLAGLNRVVTGLPKGRGWISYPFNTLMLASRYQPILDVAEQRVAAFKGMLSAVNLGGQAMRAETVFSLATTRDEQIFLDILCRALQLRNGGNVRKDGELLFIDALTQPAGEHARHARLLTKLFEHFGIQPQGVVVEIRMGRMISVAECLDAALPYRRIGCRIALCDAGAAFLHPTLLGALQPEFIKIERHVAQLAAVVDSSARDLARWMDEGRTAGSRILFDGIAEHSEAMRAIKAGADYVQGDFFAVSGKERMTGAQARKAFADLGFMAPADDLNDGVTPAPDKRHFFL
jgi:EAL domain-containing protein (putative c-di-GMP-specific phosphodiesterase class I)